ncbi:unnamed protein product [Menidia menidia]|uniref:(Atlantic silverside) hypothetical protein n=1 Tax=Menidia menidia TaxID=238744 RepID=A0A8S4BC73_9TELE|nr:unnamed protein product [Menidia menidia]
MVMVESGGLTASTQWDLHGSQKGPLVPAHLHVSALCVSSQRFCISQKANLASIQSNDEFTFLKNLIIQKGGRSRRTWIGGHDADNVWMWSDGSPFTFNSWGRGEPNNYRGQKEPCMEIMNAGEMPQKDK